MIHYTMSSRVLHVSLLENVSDPVPKAALDTVCALGNRFCLVARSDLSLTLPAVVLLKCDYECFHETLLGMTTLYH